MKGKKERERERERERTERGNKKKSVAIEGTITKIGIHQIGCVQRQIIYLKWYNG